jgi:hypothetical protein
MCLVHVWFLKEDVQWKFVYGLLWDADSILIT